MSWTGTGTRLDAGAPVARAAALAIAAAFADEEADTKSSGNDEPREANPPISFKPLPLESAEESWIVAPPPAATLTACTRLHTVVAAPPLLADELVGPFFAKRDGDRVSMIRGWSVALADETVEATGGTFLLPPLIEVGCVMVVVVVTVSGGNDLSFIPGTDTEGKPTFWLVRTTVGGDLT